MPNPSLPERFYPVRHISGNGLLNGLVLYSKMLDTSLAVGPGPWTNHNGVTFGAGPVAGEGAAVFPGPADPVVDPPVLYVDDAAGINLDSSRPHMFMAWFQAADITGSSSMPLLLKGNPTNDTSAELLGLQVDDGSWNVAGTLIPNYLLSQDHVLSDDDLQNFQKLYPTGDGTLGANDNQHWAAAGWHLALGWYLGAVDETLYLQVDGGAVISFPKTDGTGFFHWDGTVVDNSYRLAVGGVPASIGQDYADYHAYGSIGPVALWRDTLPDAAGRLAIYNSGAGLPFSSFDNS